MQTPKSSRVIVIASSVLLLVFAWLLLVDIRTSLIVGVNDDAGYYLRIARNEHIGHPGSFDWIHRTNGFNPLLKSLESAAFGVIGGQDRDTCYRIGVGITWIFSLASLALFLALMNRALARLEVGRFPDQLLLGFGCFFITWVVLKEYYGLDAFPALFFQLALVVVHTSAWKRDSWLRYAVLGVLGLLAVFSRLDCLSFVAAFGIYFGLRTVSRTLRLRNLIVFTVPIVAGFGMYVAGNFREFGVLLPVSAELKNSFPHPNIVTAFRTIVFTSSRLPNTVVFYASLACGAAVTLQALPHLLDRRWWNRDDWWREMFLPLSIYVLGHTLYFSLFSRFDFQGTYITFLSVYVLLMIVYCLRPGGYLEYLDRSRWSLVIGRLMLVAAACTLGVRVMRLTKLISQHPMDERQLGSAVEQLTAPDDVIFGDNYGLVAFFTDRAFIGGDGVVNTVEYARQGDLRGTKLAAYFDRQGVTHVFGTPGARGLSASPCTILAEWHPTLWGPLVLGRRLPDSASR